jgi:AraC-like DNA-binding protein
MRSGAHIRVAPDVAIRAQIGAPSAQEWRLNHSAGTGAGSLAARTLPAKVDWLLREGEAERPVATGRLIEIDDDHWRATIERIDIGSGMRVFLATADVRRALSLEPHHSEPEPWLVSDIAVKGSVSLALSDGQNAQITSDQSVLFRPADRRAEFTPAARQSLQLAGYMLRADRVSGMFDGNVPKAILPLIERAPAASQLVKVPTAGRIRRLAASLFSRDLRGPLRIVFMEGIVLQLFALQAGAEAASLRRRDLRAPAGRERAAILAARERLLADMRNPPTLGELAAAAGMTAKALNAGFRALFGATIFEILRNERLEHARIAIEREDVPVKQVAHRVGYNHVTNFIRAFTARFGAPPGQHGRGGVANRPQRVWR